MVGELLPESLVQVILIIDFAENWRHGTPKAPPPFCKPISSKVT